MASGPFFAAPLRLRARGKNSRFSKGSAGSEYLGRTQQGPGSSPTLQDRVGLGLLLPHPLKALTPAVAAA